MPSPLLWRYYEQERFQLTYDTFLGWDGSVALNVGTYRSASGGWRSFEDTGGSIAAMAGEPTGVLQFDTSATDNDQVVAQYGSITSVQSRISRGVTTSGTDKIVIMEGRFRFPAVANGHRFFFGLAEENVAADSFFTDAAGAIADKDHIGFYVAEGDGDAMTVVYKKEGQTAVSLATFSTALVAATWVKLGFIYRPGAADANKISFFMDGADLGTYVTLTNMAAATFPDEEEMGIVMGAGASAATAFTVDCDWVALATQL